MSYLVSYSGSVLIYYRKYSFKIFSVFFWVYACGNLAYMIYEAITGVIRVGGLLGNPNPTSALMNLAIVWLFNLRSHLGFLLSILFIAGLFLTGSRYGLLTLAVISTCFCWYLLVQGFYYETICICLSIAGGFLLYLGLSFDNLIALDRYGSLITTPLDQNIQESTTRVSIPSVIIIPSGELSVQETQFAHSVFLRLSATFGIVSAMAWLWAVLRGLWAGTRLDLSWWLLFAVFVGCWLDYYWIQPFTLMPIMWYLISFRVLTNRETI